MTHEEPMHRADPDQRAALDQPRLNLNQGHVALLGNQFLDEAAMCLDLARMPVAAARLCNGLTMLQRTLSPVDRARHADPEADRRRTATQATINRCDNPVPKVLRKRSCYPCWPPATSKKSESQRGCEGNPNRFKTCGNRSRPRKRSQTSPPIGRSLDRRGLSRFKP